MRYRKGLIFICLIICLFSIASVCASEVNETVVTSDDNNQIELSQNDDLISDESLLDFYQEDNLKNYENNEIISENQKTFNNLSAIINDNNDTDVYLDSDYTYNRGSDYSLRNGVIINRSVTIHGNGCTIDGNENARIFSVTASNVILRDIIFINGDSNANGGVIIFSNVDNCSIFNCSFINNEASYSNSAGAIYWSGNNGVISDCNFVNNTAGSSGAIYFNGMNNYIFNCTFMNNTARASKGGAIYWIGEKGNISNCSFINNKAPESSGAIYLSGKDNSISYCTFVNNIVKTSKTSTLTYGGAIVFSGGNGVVSNCFFKNNSANSSGAISWSGDNGRIFNNTFINNNAQSNSAGAIGGSSNKGYVRDCIFVNNTAQTEGGAVSWSGHNSCFFNCSFINNTGQSGSAMYLRSYFTIDGTIGHNYSVSNCYFINNNASSRGAIYLRESDNGYIFNCSFVNNSAGSGGAIYWYYSANGRVSNCSFVNNSAGGGGAIYWDSLNDGGHIFNCSFKNNFAKNNGGSIYLAGDNAKVSLCSFVTNHANSGGAVYSTGDNSSIYQCNFVNNYAQNNGGAIYCWRVDNDGVISNSLFVNNYAQNNGGAIGWYYSANGTVFNCIFLNNSANKGVIYYSNENQRYSYNFTIYNNIFLNNKCSEISFNKSDNTSNIDYNWFGNNASDYSNMPNIEIANINNWLFLNATLNNYKVPILSIYDITFNLYTYNPTSKEICEYNNSLKPINLTITATNGNVDKNVVNMGDIVKYTTNNTGKGSITATIGDVPFTVEFDIIKYYDPCLSIKSQELAYGEQIIVNLNYNASATGKVNITLKGKENYYNFSNIQLNSVIKITEMINSDEYNITVFYFGESIFLNATASASLNIIRANSTLTVNDMIFDYGSIGSCEVYFNGASGVNAEIINHTGAIVNVNGNLITVSNLNSGNYTLAITTIPNNNYNAITKLINVIVKEDSSEVDIPDEITNDEGVLSFDLPTDATGTVTITIENKNYTTTINEGKVNINLPNLKNGDYQYVITYSGDGKYSSFTKIGTITINKSSIKAQDMVINYGNDYDFKAIFFDNDGSPLANAYVIFEVNGIEHATKTDSYGFAILKLGLNSGTYTITSINTRTGETKSNKLIIKGITTHLTSSNVITVFNGGKYLVATLKDINGKPLGGVQISINLNGVKYLTTDNNGQVKLFTNGLAPNTYTATITFVGNTNYVKSTTTAKVTVKKATPKLTAAKKTFKKSVKTKKYTVTLKDNQNKAMKNIKVTIKVNKKTYTAKTNAKGKATFKIKKLTKKGKYKVTVTYKGNNCYNKVTKKVKITVK